VIRDKWIICYINRADYLSALLPSHIWALWFFENPGKISPSRIWALWFFKNPWGMNAYFWLLNSLLKGVLVYKRIHSLRNYTTSNLRLRSAESGKLSVSRDFKWPRNKLAHVFADGSSTASHNRQRTFLKAPTGTLLDIKKYIVHVWLLEERGGFKKGF